MSLAIAELTARLQRLSREELMALTAEEAAQIDFTLKDALCAEPVASFQSGPLYWLTRFTMTDDPQWEQRKLAGEAQAAYRSPFPEKSYLVPVFDAFLNHERLFIIKSRTMLTTLSAMAYAVWCAQWRNWEILVQNKNLETAEHSMRMAAAFHANQTEWLRRRHPLVQQSMLAMTWKAGGSVRALPSGQDKVRGYHSSLFIMDEAPEVVEGEESIGAIMPAGSRIIAIGTAKPGWYQLQCAR